MGKDNTALFVSVFLACCGAIIAAIFGGLLLIKGENVSDTVSMVTATLNAMETLEPSAACDDGNVCTVDMITSTTRLCKSMNLNNSIPCQDACYKPGSTCFNGQCTGTCAGYCTVDADCPNIQLEANLVPSLFTFGFCYQRTCLYGAFGVNSVFALLPQAACPGIENTYSDFCHTIIDDERNNCLKTRWCEALDICLFRFECQLPSFASPIITLQVENSTVVIDDYVSPLEGNMTVYDYMYENKHNGTTDFIVLDETSSSSVVEI